MTVANVNGLAAITIIAAEYDPLRSEVELLRDNFKKAGVATGFNYTKELRMSFLAWRLFYLKQKRRRLLPPVN